MSPGSGAVLVVTGAASGIGAAITADLRGSGWSVAGLDLQRADGCDLALCADVSDPAQVHDAVAEATRTLGPVQGVVSAAGHYAMLPVADISVLQWERMLRVHVGGLLNLVRAALPGMRERGAGSVVAVTSELAIGGGEGDAHYAAAKGAVIGLVRSLAAELAPDGVRVNAVAPGPTDTPLLAADSPWRAPDYLATLPLRRLVTPQEVARVVRFLVDEATFATGEVVSPNAGAVI